MYCDIVYNIVERRRHAFLPERSKGLDSSSSVFVLVGSNPTECTHNIF